MRIIGCKPSPYYHYPKERSHRSDRVHRQKLRREPRHSKIEAIPEVEDVNPMAYSDFTLEKAAADLGITTQEADLFTQLKPIVQPTWLREILGKRTQLALISEKARSEFIIVPILLACRDLSQNKLAIFSGQRLDVDPSLGLTGECDFILALAPPVPPLRSPILTVVEAKKNDVEAGLGQCIAQMVAANLFNRASEQAEIPIYGCVTTGEIWQFLQLLQKVVLIDEKRYYLDDVGGILAVIQAIVN